jgi:hypothetical protein
VGPARPDPPDPLRSRPEGARGHPDDVELSGRLIGPDKPDEGIRIDGVVLYTLPDLDIPMYAWSDEPEVAEGVEVLWRVAREEYGLDDALTCFESIRACAMGFGMAPARRGWWLRWYSVALYEDCLSRNR